MAYYDTKIASKFQYVLGNTDDPVPTDEMGIKTSMIVKQVSNEEFDLYATDGAGTVLKLKTSKNINPGLPEPQDKNKLSGKKISFIGDSITSWGTNSTEYNSDTGYEFEDTWMGKFLTLTGGIKGKLDGQPGTAIQAIVHNGQPYNITIPRVDDIPEDTDYIIIFMGANDQRNMNSGDYKLGDIAKKGSLGEFKITNENFKSFFGAYQLFLEKLLSKYPKSKVILMTPLKSFKPNEQVDRNPESDKYAEAVISIAKLYGLQYIDTREIGINNYNHELFFIDGLHPNKDGHKILGKFVASKILEFGTVGTIDSNEYYTKSQIDEKLKSLPKGGGSSQTSPQKEIIIGGANLVENSALPKLTPNNTGLGLPVVMKDETGYFVRYTPDPDKVVANYGFFLAGSNLGNHTRSIDVRHTHTSNISIWGKSIPPGSWVRIKQENFTAPSGWMGINCDTPGVTVDLRNYKIELGNKATDWIPHLNEYKLGVSDHMIDTVLPWNTALNIVGETNGENDRTIYGLPRIESIAEILEFKLVQLSGTVTEIKGLKVVTTSAGKLGMPFKAKDVGSPVKVYIKALLK